VISTLALGQNENNENEIIVSRVLGNSQALELLLACFAVKFNEVVHRMAQYTILTALRSPFFLLSSHNFEESRWEGSIGRSGVDRG